MPPVSRLRYLFVLVGGVALSAFGVLESCSRSAAEGPDFTPAFPAPNQSTPEIVEVPRPDPARLPKLSPELPLDLEFTSEAGDPAASDRAADTFAWDTFVALHWPPRSDGEPDKDQLPGHHGDNPTVWETWPEASQIFLPEGRVPAAWGMPPDAGSWPAALRELPPGTRVFTRTGKQTSSLAAGAPAGPLIDQNGRHVRTETRVNRASFDYIVAHQLYRRQSQANSGPLSFPAGDSVGANSTGAIRVQAAWKILSPAEIAAGRFHATEAVIYTAPEGSPTSGAGTIEPVTVGLVGLHIARKTPSSPGWIWATFEHVDNCPTAGEPADRAAYNFYDKSAGAPPPNQPPPGPWNPAAIEPASKRSQIVRQTPIPVATRALNAAYQAVFRSLNPASPWQYYELVGALRHTPPGGGRDTPSRPLANTTLEGYLAIPAKPAPGCIDCHARATTASGASADYSFLLHLAR